MEGTNNKDEVTLYRYNRSKVIKSESFLLFINIMFLFCSIFFAILLPSIIAFEHVEVIIIVVFIVLFIYQTLNIWFYTKSMLKVKITNLGFHIFDYLFIPFMDDIFIPLESIKEITRRDRRLYITTKDDKTHSMYIIKSEYNQVKNVLKRLSFKRDGIHKK